LKYLFVLALLALLGWFLYRRLRPYLQLLRNFLKAFKGTLDLNANEDPADFGVDQQNAQSRLVRCAECNTWIPLSRALTSGSTNFCSSACLKKFPVANRRKTAG
jgi:hypothetical protein